MTKTDIKKARVNICAGFYGQANANIILDGFIIGRIGIDEIEKLVKEKLERGEFTLTDKGRKYQHIKLDL